MQASLFGYVEMDYPLASPEEAAAYEKKMAEIEARIAPLAAEDPRRSRSRTARGLLPAKYKKFPDNVQQRHRDSGREAHAGPGAAGRTGDPHQCRFRADEIDRVMTPEDLAQKKALNAADPRRSRRSGRSRFRWRMGVTDGDYRFTPDGPGDEPAPGKGVKNEAIEGSFLFNGPGRLSGAAFLFSDPRRSGKPGLVDEAGIRQRDHVRQSAGGDSAGGRAHFRDGGGRWPNGSARRRIR